MQSHLNSLVIVTCILFVSATLAAPPMRSMAPQVDSAQETVVNFWWNADINDQPNGDEFYTMPRDGLYMSRDGVNFFRVDEAQAAAMALVTRSATFGERIAAIQAYLDQQTGDAFEFTAPASFEIDPDMLQAGPGGLVSLRIRTTQTSADPVGPRESTTRDNGQGAPVPTGACEDGPLNRCDGYCPRCFKVLWVCWNSTCVRVKFGIPPVVVEKCACIAYPAFDCGDDCGNGETQQQTGAAGRR